MGAFLRTISLLFFCVIAAAFARPTLPTVACLPFIDDFFAEYDEIIHAEDVKGSRECCIQARERILTRYKEVPLSCRELSSAVPEPTKPGDKPKEIVMDAELKDQDRSERVLRLGGLIFGRQYSPYREDNQLSGNLAETFKRAHETALSKHAATCRNTPSAPAAACRLDGNAEECARPFRTLASLLHRRRNQVDATKDMEGCIDLTATPLGGRSPPKLPWKCGKFSFRGLDSGTREMIGVNFRDLQDRPPYTTTAEALGPIFQSAARNADVLVLADCARRFDPPGPTSAKSPKFVPRPARSSAPAR